MDQEETLGGEAGVLHVKCGDGILGSNNNKCYDDSF